MNNHGGLKCIPNVAPNAVICYRETEAYVRFVTGMKILTNTAIL